MSQHDKQQQAQQRKQIEQQLSLDAQKRAKGIGQEMQQQGAKETQAPAATRWHQSPNGRYGELQPQLDKDLQQRQDQNREMEQER